MDVEIGDNAINVGGRLAISFQRTLRVPDDGRPYPLPPGLGRFPILAVTGALASLPEVTPGDAIIPMHQDEALWLGFDGASWKPSAVKVAAGSINVLTGERDEDGLVADPQNYMVCPPQPWLDGINAAAARVRQFVATPLGLNDTIEGQLSGAEQGGISVSVYGPKAGIFPDAEPPPDARPQRLSRPMGLGAGGAIVQRIYPDPFGLDTWDQGCCARVRVHILNSAQFEALTGREAPPTPISAATYTEHGLPWFALYNETLGDIAAADRLAAVRSIDERERERKPGTEKEAAALPISEAQVTILHRADPGTPPGSPNTSRT